MAAGATSSVFHAQLECIAQSMILPAMHRWISLQEPDLCVLCAACWQKKSCMPLSCI